MHRFCASMAVLICLVFPTAVPAVQPDEVLSDPALEERARELSTRIRCMVCQNQSIDDSDAPLARDLRILVRERLTKGDSDDQVIDYLVDRYGEFVLLQPVFAIHTLVLWLSPVLLLIAGGLAIWLTRRRPTPTTSTGAVPLTDDEQAAINKILSNDD